MVAVYFQEKRFLQKVIQLFVAEEQFFGQTFQISSDATSLTLVTALCFRKIKLLFE